MIAVHVFLFFTIDFDLKIRISCVIKRWVVARNYFFRFWPCTFIAIRWNCFKRRKYFYTHQMGLNLTSVVYQEQRTIELTCYINLLFHDSSRSAFCFSNDMLLLAEKINESKVSTIGSRYVCSTLQAKQ